MGQILSEHSVSYFEGFAFINIDVFFREMRRNHEIGAFYPGIFRLLEDIKTLKDVSQISLATKHLKFKSLLRMALKLHTIRLNGTHALMQLSSQSFIFVKELWKLLQIK